MKPTRGPVDVTIAFISLVLSIVLFMVIIPTWMSRRSRPIKIPLTYERDTLPAHFYIDKQPTSVTIKATLSDSEYENFLQTGKAVANLTSAEPGEKSYPVSLEPPQLRKYVENQNIQAAFTLEASVRKDVRVFVTSSGKFSDPTEFVDNMVADTKKVSIEGPAVDIARVTGVRATLRLDMLQGTGPQQISVPLEAVDKDDHVVENVDIRPSQVMVTPQFSLAPQQKQEFVDVTFGPGKVPDGYEVKSYSVEPTHVTVSGSSQSLARIGKVTTTMIDITGLTQTQTFTVGLRPVGPKSIPADLKFSPSTVQVTVVVGQQRLKGLNPATTPIVPKSGTLGAGR